MHVYIPLLGASPFEVVGALATGETSYQYLRVGIHLKEFL
jgi:hypothetical protein